MEKLLEDKLHAIMARPGVVGVVCTDTHGLCLAAKGVGTPQMSGMICNVAEQAKKIDPTNEHPYPIIRLESEKGYCLIQKKKLNDFTLAIFKKYPAR